MDVSSFAKRRPPKFAEPLDWDKLSPPFDSSSTSTTLGNDFSYASLYDRLFQNGLSSSNTTTSTSDWQNLDSRTLNYAASSLLSPMFSNSTFANNNGYTGNTFGQFGRSTPNPITNGSNNNPANGSIGNSDIAGSSATSPFTNGIASSLNYSNPNQNNSFTPDPWGQYAPRSCPPIGSRDTLGFGQFTMGVANSNQGNQSTYVPPRVRRRQPTCTECVFCKNNGQPPSFYKSHILKDPEGNTLCPILRRYNCPICHNNGGNRAHTLRYCPKNKPLFWQKSRP